EVLIDLDHHRRVGIANADTLAHAGFAVTGLVAPHQARRRPAGLCLAEALPGDQPTDRGEDKHDHAGDADLDRPVTLALQLGLPRPLRAQPLPGGLRRGLRALPVAHAGPSLPGRKRARTPSAFNSPDRRRSSRRLPTGTITGVPPPPVHVRVLRPWTRRLARRRRRAPCERTPTRR